MQHNLYQPLDIVIQNIFFVKIMNHKRSFVLIDELLSIIDYYYYLVKASSDTDCRVCMIFICLYPTERILVMLSRQISVSAVAAVGLVIVERPCRHTALAAAIVKFL